MAVMNLQYKGGAKKISLDLGRTLQGPGHCGYSYQKAKKWARYKLVRFQNLSLNRNKYLWCLCYVKQTDMLLLVPAMRVMSWRGDGQIGMLVGIGTQNKATWGKKVINHILKLDTNLLKTETNCSSVTPSFSGTLTL